MRRIAEDVRCLLLNNYAPGRFAEHLDDEGGTDILRLWDDKVGLVQSGVLYKEQGDDDSDYFDDGDIEPALGYGMILEDE
jgi:hypothetical protein